MGITEKVASLLPWRGERHEPPARRDTLALHEDFDRWRQRFFEDPWALLEGLDAQREPFVEVQETDKDLVVRAEVPGLDRDDIALTITADRLIIRGEKREERKDEGKGGEAVEWRYGSFVQTVPLPPGIDVDAAEAKLKNGVLTVRFPKTASERVGTNRIAIRT